jgi:nucleoside 2-deoxyribosyltransferase
MKLYLAAPIFNPHQLEVVEMIKGYAEDEGHEVFSPYHESRDIWAGRAPKDCSPNERRQVVFNNVRRLDWAEVVLAWVGGYPEGFTDPGVLWELGYAGCRSGVPAIETAEARVPFSVGYVDDTDTRRGMNLMLAGTLDYGVLGATSLQRFLFDISSESEMAPSDLKVLYHTDLTMMQEADPIS